MRALLWILGLLCLSVILSLVLCCLPSWTVKLTIEPPIKGAFPDDFRTQFMENRASLVTFALALMALLQVHFEVLTRTIRRRRAIGRVETELDRWREHQRDAIVAGEFISGSLIVVLLAYWIVPKWLELGWLPFTFAQGWMVTLLVLVTGLFLFYCRSWWKYYSSEDQDETRGGAAPSLPSALPLQLNNLVTHLSAERHGGFAGLDAGDSPRTASADASGYAARVNLHYRDQDVYLVTLRCAARRGVPNDDHWRWCRDLAESLTPWNREQSAAALESALETARGDGDVREVAAGETRVVVRREPEKVLVCFVPASTIETPVADFGVRRLLESSRERAAIIKTPTYVSRLTSGVPYVPRRIRRAARWAPYV